MMLSILLFYNSLIEI